MPSRVIADGELAGSGRSPEASRASSSGLDSIDVLTYGHNLRDASETADPGHAAEHRASAVAYAEKPEALDAWMIAQIAIVSKADRVLADQIAAEAHVKVTTDLLDHSLTLADGLAPAYLAMMRYVTQVIVNGLHQATSGRPRSSVPKHQPRDQLCRLLLRCRDRVIE